MRQSQRRNNVVERVKKASAGRFTLVSENAAVGDTQLRPDLVLVCGEEAVVVDACIPFENRKEALVQARRTTEEKYRLVIDQLRRRYQRVTVEAVVVGALGSWGPGQLGPCQRSLPQKTLFQVLPQEDEADGRQRHHPGLQGHPRGPHRRTHAKTGTRNEAGRKKMHVN